MTTDLRAGTNLDSSRPLNDLLVEEICRNLGIPKSVWDADRTKLASTQFEEESARSEEYWRLAVRTKVIDPFIDRLVAEGVIPPPADEPTIVESREDGR